MATATPTTIAQEVLAGAVGVEIILAAEAVPTTATIYPTACNVTEIVAIATVTAAAMNPGMDLCITQLNRNCGIYLAFEAFFCTLQASLKYLPTLIFIGKFSDELFFFLFFK